MKFIDECRMNHLITERIMDERGSGTESINRTVSAKECLTHLEGGTETLL